MQKEWPLTEPTLFFMGLRMDKAHFPGAEGGSPSTMWVVGVQPSGAWSPAWRRLTGLHYLLHLKMTKTDPRQSIEVFKKPTLNRNIWS